MKGPIEFTLNEAKPAIDYYDKYIGAISECWEEYTIFYKGYKLNLFICFSSYNILYVNFNFSFIL